MKKLNATIAAVLGLFVISQNQAGAAPVTYEFHPFDNSSVSTAWDINDLDHYQFYYWGISNFSLSPDVHIIGASLTFNNIYDWQAESNDKLYIHLLDNKPISGGTIVKSTTGVDADSSSAIALYDTKLTQWTDNQGGGDAFTGNGTLVAPVWSDPVGGLPANTISYDFSRLGGLVSNTGDIIPGNINILTTLETYLRNGNDFGFGIDPDCHYYNDKVTFTITVDSTPVPEPTTLLLFGAGLAGLAAMSRRKMK